jgi:hypothetical protein
MLMASSCQACGADDRGEAELADSAGTSLEEGEIDRRFDIIPSHGSVGSAANLDRPVTCSNRSSVLPLEVEERLDPPEEGPTPWKPPNPPAPRAKFGSNPSSVDAAPYWSYACRLLSSERICKVSKGREGVVVSSPCRTGF